ERDLGYVMDAVRLIRRELNDRAPLIGFAGSPWTLACYMIEGEGSSSFARAKALAWNDAATMHRLLDVVARSVAAYLIAQAKAGAQALMVFDTWGGLLAPAQFREFSLRWLGEIASLLRADPVAKHLPLILFSKGANAHLEALADTGCAALGVDWTISIGEARRRVGSRVALQGNLDPVVLAASPEAIRKEARAVLDDFGAHPGHVFNLGHGITPDIDPAHVAVLVDAVHEMSRNVSTG
ncbi:MAG TPA: uroporphyrinogen decarboxylase family protein, partial [Rhodanobacteraceae bacterium]|nr:uroporphyrinogen decarboxylase family protein [Rhodanobacteraceae bacterium]